MIISLTLVLDHSTTMYTFASRRIVKVRENLKTYTYTSLSFIATNKIFTIKIKKRIILPMQISKDLQNTFNSNDN